MGQWFSGEEGTARADSEIGQSSSKYSASLSDMYFD